MTPNQHSNPEIARLFDDLADVLEIKKDSWFKVRAYRRAAQVIRDLPEPLRDRVRQGRNLTAISGIGDAIAKKTAELVNTGRVATYDREMSSLPALVQLLADVPGVSPKTAWRLVQDTGAVGRDELLTDLAAPAPRGLPEEGEGSLQAIRDHLSARIPGAR